MGGGRGKGYQEVISWVTEWVGEIGEGGWEGELKKEGSGGGGGDSIT